jgi:alcohol dehydrogenase, propanol-preferring
MLCAGVTVFAALNRSRALPGQWVVISGVGGLGHLACQLARRGMGYRVIAIDHGSKEALAMESGAEHFIDFTTLDNDGITGHVKALTGGLGAHAAVVCTAANAAYAQALKLLRFNGTLVCVGVPEGDYVDIVGATPGPMINKHLTITGSAVGNRVEAIRTLEFAERGIIKAHYEVAKMEQLTDIFERMTQGKLRGRVVLDLS